jgi:hypothetical protein
VRSTGVSRFRLRRVGAALIALAAICLQRAATLPWGVTAQGTQYEISPFGVKRTGGADSLASCRWWPPMGNAELCAPGADSTAFGRIRKVYPLLASAMWIAVVALFLQVLGIPRRTVIRSAVTWVVAVLAMAATGFMLTSLPEALGSFTRTDLQWRGTGFVLACVATILAVTSGILSLARDTPPPP